ncbi:MAG: glycosyltransferase family 4 protein [Bacteroidales bacterium]|nr:glycosyltransferase family 4 protein [Bacteroidales bacterium]
MKVVFIHTDFRIYWPLRLRYLKEVLESIGHELLVIEISGKGSPYSFADHNNESGSWWHCLYPDDAIEDLNVKDIRKCVCQKLDDVAPDIVFSGAIAFPSGANAVYWCKNNNKPVVIFDDARLHDVPRSIITNMVKKRLFANVESVFLPSSSYEKDYNYWGFSEDEMFYGLNVVDNEFWKKETEKNLNRKREYRVEYNLPDNYFLGVGRLVAKKNWITLLKAYKMYCEQIQNPASLVIVGDGPEKDHLVEYLVKNDLSNVILRPFQTQQQLAIYYLLSKVVILPSIVQETWGLVINEAMASGKPVLVSNRCGCSDVLVKNNYNGWKFSPNDIDELSDLLFRVSELSDCELSVMGNRSMELIRDWSLDRFCSGVLGAIEKNKKSGKSPKFLDNYILLTWKGRYRPA